MTIRSQHPGANPGTISELASQTLAQLNPKLRNIYIAKHRKAQGTWQKARSLLFKRSLIKVKQVNSSVDKLFFGK